MEGKDVHVRIVAQLTGKLQAWKLRREQVRQIAIERMKRTTHTMILEDQQLQEPKRKKKLQSMIEDLMREMPKDLWSVKS